MLPQSGDSIQAMKAGLMEIGDLFVLNKSDHENAEHAFGELQSILSLKPTKDDWKLPVIKTVAHQMNGISELMDTLSSHRNYLDKEKRLQTKRYDRIRKRLYLKIENKLQIDFWSENKKEHFKKLVFQLFNGDITYKQALKDLF